MTLTLKPVDLQRSSSNWIMQPVVDREPKCLISKEIENKKFKFKKQHKVDVNIFAEGSHTCNFEWKCIQRHFSDKVIPNFESFEI